MSASDAHEETGGPDQVCSRLKAASEIIEDCAFQVAGHRPSDVVAQLIIIAADLERLSMVLANEAGADENGNG